MADTTPEQTTPAAPELPDWVQEMNSALDRRMGIQLVEVSPQRVVATMPVEGNTQPVGLLHGGANAVIAESVASVGAFAHARQFDEVAVGLDLNITHHRAVRRGTVTAVATPVHLGRTLATYEVEITDDQGRRSATGRLTCLLVAR